MGVRFTEPVILNLEAMHSESRPMTPLICFLSTGSDPTPYIEQLAKRLENKCKCISMGQGQETHARKLLTQAMSDVSYFSFLKIFPNKIMLLINSSGFLGVIAKLPFRIRLHERSSTSILGNGKRNESYPS